MRVSDAKVALLHRLECKPIMSKGQIVFARLTAHRGSVVVNQWDIPLDDVQSLLQTISSPEYAVSILERLRVGVAVHLTITGRDLLDLAVHASSKHVRNEAPLSLARPSQLVETASREIR
jgi:hypothetical protein